MMGIMNVRFAGKVPVLAMLGLLVVGVLLVLWAYRRNRDRLSSRHLILLALLRVGLVGLLLCCLVEPVFSFRAGRRDQAPVLFLVDVSKSMSLKDVPSGETRLEASLKPWLGDLRLAKALERRFAVRYFAFDAATRGIESRDALEGQQPNGDMTLVGEALLSAASQANAESITGVVLLTDGADQSTVDPIAQARSLGAPFYVVGVGDVSSTYTGKPDIAVTDLSGERFMSLNTQNELAVTLEQRGRTGQSANIEVRVGDKPVATETVECTTPTVKKSISVVPEQLGKQVFRVVVQPFDGEEIAENNERQFTAIVSDKQLNVLFIEGTPRWEYKYLKRALEWDPAVTFTGFVQSAQGLFLRQGQETGSGVLPVSREEFAQFHVTILGDVSPTMFSAQQLAALHEVVTEDGKGLAMIPGPKSRENGGFASTPLAGVLPALPAQTPAVAVQSFVPELTADGIAHPVFAGLDELVSPSNGLELPGCYALDSLSAGASVLANCPASRAGGTALPIFVTQVAGKGRAMVLGIDSTWRWRLKGGGGSPAASLHGRLWAQAVRWLAAREENGDEEGPRFMAYASSDYYEPGQEPLLFARLRREKDDAPGAEVSAQVSGPTGVVVNTPLEFVAGSGGLYRVKLDAGEAGEYVAKLSAAAEGQTLGEDETHFFVGRPYQEFDRVAMNEQLLRRLALESGGAFHTPADAAAIPDELVAAASERALFVERQVAKSPAIYILMVICASVEWYLRKRQGLM